MHLGLIGVEEKAQRKEKILTAKGKDPEEFEEVNDMIITSIKAKLAMLKGI